MDDNKENGGGGMDRGRESPMDLDRPRANWLDAPQVPPPMFRLSAGSPASPASSKIPIPTTPHSGIPFFRRDGSKSGPRVRPRPHTPSRLSKSVLTRRVHEMEFGSDEEDDVSTDGGKNSKRSRAMPHSHPRSRFRFRLRWPPGLSLPNPYVLMGYVQLFFNAALVVGMLYVLLSVYLTVRRDVDLKVEEQLSVLLTEIAQCSKQYLDNRCAPETRVPAMEKSCAIWESCMRRDPSVIGRARVSAQTFAEIINGFIEPISYKTMIFGLITLFGTVLLSNVALSFARARIQTSTPARPTSGPPPMYYSPLALPFTPHASPAH